MERTNKKDNSPVTVKPQRTLSRACNSWNCLIFEALF